MSLLVFPSDQLPPPRIAQAPQRAAYQNLQSGPFNSGRSVLARQRVSKLFEFDVTWSHLCWESYVPLMQFFDLCYARFLPFWFLVPWGSGYPVNERLGWTHVFIGTSDGNDATTWQLPLREYWGDDLVIYEDHVPIDRSRYVLDASGFGLGEAGTVVLTWNTGGAATVGKFLTCGGHFSPLIKARFAQDKLEWTPGVGYVFDVKTQINEERIIP